MDEEAPAFARDRATQVYYERRAAEYDEWYEGTGAFAVRSRPGWHEEVAQVGLLLRSLPEVSTLDVACGTAYLARHLQGVVVGLDRSSSMLAIARARLARRAVVAGDALRLPFADGAFDRIVTGHFYGHLPPTERSTFLAETGRVAAELVVVDSALRPGVEPEGQQERVLNDGSRHVVYKRYLTAAQLAGELHGEPLFNGRWFVVAAHRAPTA